MPFVPAMETIPSDKPTTSGTSKRPAIILFKFRAPVSLIPRKFNLQS